MNKELIIEKILQREKLRKMGRFERLFNKPIRTFIYYLFACAARIRPFTITFKTIWGEKFTCDLPNGNTFLYYGSPEANLTNFFIKNIQPGATFIDCGSNVGFYSLLASNLVGDSGHVYSFEPTPSTFRILCKNLSKKKNAVLNRLALMDTEQETEFIDYGIGYNSFNSIVKRKNEHERIKGRDTKIVVKAVSLDSYCKNNKVITDFIKFDLEGAEYLALTGSSEILSKQRPILSIEVAGGDEGKENIRLSDKILKQHNYTSFAISNSGILHTHKMLESYEYDNLIYLPNEKISEYINN